MEKSKSFLSALGLMMMVALIGLSALNESRLEVYYSLFTVIYFAASALYRPRRRWYDVVGAVLFLGFCYIVALKVIDIIY